MLTYLYVLPKHPPQSQYNAILQLFDAVYFLFLLCKEWQSEEEKKSVCSDRILTQRHLWHFENARRADMSNFLFDFPWDDYCFRTRDPDLAAAAVGEVRDSGMRAYIPYSLITFSPSKPWFDRACSSAISDREGVHRSYQASPSELTHATFISARNRCSA